MILYHATILDFDNFKLPETDIGLHFGTKQAAFDRMGERRPFYLYTVDIDIKNSVEIDDVAASSRALEIALTLVRHNHISQNEYNKLIEYKRSKPSITQEQFLLYLREYLINKNIYILEYINNCEDIGSKSYAVLKTDLIKIINKETIT